MIRTAVFAALLTAVLVGGFFIGATRVFAGEMWPEW